MSSLVLNTQKAFNKHEFFSSSSHSLSPLSVNLPTSPNPLPTPYFLSTILASRFLSCPLLNRLILVNPPPLLSDIAILCHPLPYSTSSSFQAFHLLPLLSLPLVFNFYLETISNVQEQKKKLLFLKYLRVSCLHNASSPLDVQYISDKQGHSPHNLIQLSKPGN